MSASDIIDLCLKAAKSLEVPDDVADDVAEALDKVKLTSFVRIQARPALLDISNGAALGELQARMHNTGMTDDDDHNDLVGALLCLVRDHFKAATAGAPSPGGLNGVAPRATEDEEDAASTKESYARLEKYFNVQVDRRHRCTFVGRASREVKKNGQPGSLPSFGKFSTQGMNGVTKSVRLGGTTSMLMMGEDAPIELDDLGKARYYARAYFRGLAAVFMWPIPITAYGGRDVGYVEHGGKQLRLLATLEAMDDLLWEVIRQPCTDVKSFTELVDKVVQELISVYCRGKQHLAEISVALIERDEWWRVPGQNKGVDRDVSGGTGRPKTNASNPVGNKGGKLVCASWLANGGCRFIDDGCAGAHPPAMANLARGKGGQSGKGGGKGGGKGQGQKRGRDSEKKDE